MLDVNVPTFPLTSNAYTEGSLEDQSVLEKSKSNGIVESTILCWYVISHALYDIDLDKVIISLITTFKSKTTHINLNTSFFITV